MAAKNVQVPGGDSWKGGVPAIWLQFFHLLQQQAFNATLSGTTAQRPNSDFEGRWIGMCYFDSTLGKPVFLKSVGPDVWVDGVGTVS